MGINKMRKQQKKLLPSSPTLLNSRLNRIWARSGDNLVKHNRYVVKQFNRRWDFWCRFYE